MRLHHTSIRSSYYHSESTVVLVFLKMGKVGYINCNSKITKNLRTYHFFISSIGSSTLGRLCIQDFEVKDSSLSSRQAIIKFCSGAWLPNEKIYSNIIKRTFFKATVLLLLKQYISFQSVSWTGTISNWRWLAGATGFLCKAKNILKSTAENNENLKLFILAWCCLRYVVVVEHVGAFK